MIRYDDLQLIDMGEDYLIIACDSSGAIGNKEMDLIQLEPELAGYYAAIVPMIEVMAVRGSIISVVDTLSVEMEPTGRRIIDGISQALLEAGVRGNPLTGSTEDNIPTKMTGIGVTVIGKASKGLFSKDIPQNSVIVVIGKPKMGQQFLQEEVIERRGEVLNLSLMKSLIQDHRILDMIPVGSKGIAYELNNLMKRHNVKADIQSTKNKESLDLKVSAGPSTCLVAILKEDQVEEFMKDYPMSTRLGVVSI